METFDIVYLCDPEIHYGDNDDDATFASKIKEAFSTLEELVTKGTIQKYGIHSKFLADETKRKFTLKQYLDVAVEVGGEGHHFEYINVPHNLIERQAYRCRAYNGSIDNLFQNAHHYDMFTFGHRPLHAISKEGKSLKFVDVRVDNHTHSFEPSLQDPNRETALATFIQSLNETIQFENTLPDHEQFPTDIMKTHSEELPHIGALRWGQILSSNLNKLDTLHTWEHVLETRIRPELHYAHDKLRKSKEG